MSDEVAAPPSDGGGQSTVTSTPAPASTPATTPSAPAQTEAPVPSRREAIQRAFAKVDAEPKAEPKIDSTGRVHGPDGKFAPKTEGETSAAAPPAEPPKPKRPPLPRLAKPIQEKWETLGEDVHDEWYRMHDEMNAGIEKYKPGHEAYEALKAFDERARQTGTTLADALRNYTGIEDMLRSNPVAGVVQIARNIGVHPVAIAQQILRIAQGQQGHPQQQQFNPQQAFAPYANKIQSLEKTIEEMQSAPLKQEIEKLQAEKPFFEHLRPKMAKLVMDGKAQTPAEAYEMAVAEDPHIKEAIEALNARKAAPEAQQPRQTQEQIQEKAKLSVTGSPTVGSNPSNRKPAGSAREAVQNALSQVGLR
jgi:hypothetical protein